MRQMEMGPERISSLPLDLFVVSRADWPGRSRLGMIGKDCVHFFGHACTAVSCQRALYDG